MANQQTRQLQRLAHKNGIHKETFFAYVSSMRGKVPIVEIGSVSHSHTAFSEERAKATRERRLQNAKFQQQRNDRRRPEGAGAAVR